MLHASSYEPKKCYLPDLYLSVGKFYKYHKIKIIFVMNYPRFDDLGTREQKKRFNKNFRYADIRVNEHYACLT
jgi:hypothetical protein